MSVRTETAHWQHRDPVTLDICGRLTTGTAVVFHGRKDQQRFVKVEITSGDQKGLQVWPDDFGWALGTGVRLFHCADCGHPSRSDDPKEILCLDCTRNERPNDPNDPGSANLRWRTEDRAQGRQRG
jgi:hypothetical protein